ncbi:hypothetical protein [Rummeliibacillus pycnus]|uniref:hypothetical protein n=1 Tax=Rummeliibacillus pycnus TaxID=101070 RepID=UPI000C9ADCB2|nr:hypothetical protein [Rummeliibacillus pycnus]
MVMTYPIDHRMRYGNFELKGYLDETLREGAERCLFTVEENEKYRLIEISQNLAFESNLL